MLHTPVPSNPPNARRYEPVVGQPRKRKAAQNSTPKLASKLVPIFSFGAFKHKASTPKKTEAETCFSQRMPLHNTFWMTSSLVSSSPSCRCPRRKPHFRRICWHHFLAMRPNLGHLPARGASIPKRAWKPKRWNCATNWSTSMHPVGALPTEKFCFATHWAVYLSAKYLQAVARTHQCCLVSGTKIAIKSARSARRNKSRMGHGASSRLGTCKARRFRAFSANSIAQSWL